jgi:predicted nucleic acid-binding protein
MAAPVALDAGPLVALLDRNDPWHEWARAQLDSLTEPMLTCEAVLSEAAFLLEHSDPGHRRLMGLLNEDIVRLAFDLDDHLNAVATLMSKYDDVPISLADACLVRMSEIHDRAHVFTLDSDFKRYRRHGRQAIPLIYPEA